MPPGSFLGGPRNPPQPPEGLLGPLPGGIQEPPKKSQGAPKGFQEDGHPSIEWSQNVHTMRTDPELRFQAFLGLRLESGDFPASDTPVQGLQSSGPKMLMFKLRRFMFAFSSLRPKTNNLLALEASFSVVPKSVQEAIDVATTPQSK